MKNSTNLNPFFNTVKEGNPKKEFMNLKITTREILNNRRHLI